MDADPRALLESLIRERREDYAALSRLIGRNPAYIQQFIKRGSPRRLAEEDRRRLARYFGIDEALLGGRETSEPSAADALVRIPRLDVAASAGAGAADTSERALGRIGFDPSWLRRLGVAPASAALIRVEGDSMAPTLSDGDEILVDRGDRAGRLRDGLYVLRFEGALLVKRLSVSPAGGRVSILSDNPAYPGWPDCDPAAVDVVGRVLWVGRRL
ncbi:MAG TPA: S24 family peptidase [Allosphingosinicella sp.]|jgi:phage repressor protein C with HTH and peptisase S24 domain